MKKLALVSAAALSLLAAAPAFAQAYNGGAGVFDGIGADQSAFPGTIFDRVTFTAASGNYTGPGHYVLNNVTLEVGINRNNDAAFSGVFNLVGSFNGTPFNYALNYTGNISSADTITIGGQFITVDGNTQVWINPLTLSGGVGSYSGNLIATTGGVPEPAAWGMMIGGFGLAGMALRRRAKVSTTVRYA